jgi:hypothetical protein
MVAKKIPLTASERRIGSVRAYDIHLERQKNEDRILAERTSMFLLATSFLFLAFATLLCSNCPDCITKPLGFILSGVGISLTLLLLQFNIRATKALGRWHDAQCKIEKSQEAVVFKYMEAKGISPHGRKSHWLTSTRTIYRCYLPLVFLALWVTSLVFFIKCYP